MTVTIGAPDDRDRIDEQASEWLILREERELSEEEQRAFDAWCAADVRHFESYEAMQRTWHDIPQLTGLAQLVAAPHENSPSSPSGSASRSGWRFTGRRAFAAGAAVAAVIAMLAMPGLLTNPVAPSQYATKIAEVRHVTLPDGSQVTLGPRSTLEMKFTDGERRVVLAGGEAFFDVTHDAGRPFLVEAGSSLIRVVGTKFDVNNSGSTVRVSVLEGKVQVSQQRSGAVRDAAPAQVLTAGQRIELTLILPASPAAAAATTPPAVQPVNQTVGGWRDGRLSYDDAKLSDLIADVNRYYAPGVTLGDAAAGDIRITASFRTSEIPAFMTVVSDVVPIKVDTDANGSFRIESKSK